MELIGDRGYGSPPKEFLLFPIYMYFRSIIKNFIKFGPLKLLLYEGEKSFWRAQDYKIKLQAPPLIQNILKIDLFKNQIAIALE